MWLIPIRWLLVELDRLILIRDLGSRINLFLPLHLQHLLRGWLHFFLDTPHDGCIDLAKFCALGCEE